MSRTRRPSATRERNTRIGKRNGTPKNTSRVAKPRPKQTRKRKAQQPRPREASIELGVVPSIETPTQHEEVEKYMRDEGTYDDFLILPEAKEFTFEDSEEEMKRFGLFSRKLFLGGKMDPSYYVWSYLKTYEHKARDVFIYVTTGKPDNDVQRMSIVGSSWGDVQLMYPFQIFARVPNVIARKQLNTLIQYTFLDAKEMDTIWKGEAKYNFALLKSAVRKIAKAYKKFPGGKSYSPSHCIAAVPDTIRPSDLRVENVPSSPTAAPTISHLTEQMERVTVTPHPGGPNSDAEEPQPQAQPDLQAPLNQLQRIKTELTKLEEMERKIAARKRALERRMEEVKEQIYAAVEGFAKRK